MKLSQIIIMRWNREVASGAHLPEHEISQPSSSRPLPAQQQIELIRQPGGWQADIGEKVLSALVELPQWPYGRTVSVNENNCEICRYGADGRMTEFSGVQDIMLIRAAGYYQSTSEFYEGVQPDGDSLFRAIIIGLGENRYTNSADITQQILIWRNRVADCLLEQERKSLPLAGATKSAVCGEKRRRNIDIANDALAKKRSVKCIENPHRYCYNMWSQRDKEIYKTQFSKILPKYYQIMTSLRDSKGLMTKKRLFELELNIFSLYNAVTEKIAKNHLTNLLHNLNMRINAWNKGQGLTFYPRHPAFVSMPQTTETSSLEGTAARVYGLPQPERWPKVDAETQRQQFPDITTYFEQLIKSVKIQQALSLNQVKKLENKLWFLYYQLQSMLAKNDIARSLYELQEILDSADEGLKIDFIPLYVYKDIEFSITPKYIDFTLEVSPGKSVSKWPKEDRDKQRNMYPSFVKDIIRIRHYLKKQSKYNYQKQITLFELKLHRLYQQVHSQQVKDDIVNIFFELKYTIKKSGKNLFLEHFPCDIDIRKANFLYGNATQSLWDAASQESTPGAMLSGTGVEVKPVQEYFTQENIAGWPKVDQSKQRVLFTDIFEKFLFIKRKLQQPHRYFYQEWINVFENRVLVLYNEVISSRAKRDIIHLLYELEEAVQQSGRGLVLQRFHHMMEGGSNTFFRTIWDRESNTLSFLPESVTAGDPVQGVVARSGSDPQSVATEVLSDSGRIGDLRANVVAGGGPSVATAKRTRIDAELTDFW